MPDILETLTLSEEQAVLITISEMRPLSHNCLMGTLLRDRGDTLHNFFHHPLLHRNSNLTGVRPSFSFVLMGSFTWGLRSLGPELPTPGRSILAVHKYNGYRSAVKVKKMALVPQHY
jgi:hypothetical protein